MDDNSAAWLVRFKRKPLDVDEADSRFADENEIVIRNAAVSVNPIDTVMQDQPYLNWTYPTILGTDVAGEVTEVGSMVQGFSEGDRVMGHALRLATDDDRHGGFQKFTVLMPNMACIIPRTLSYENAATLPLGISTASAALFQDSSLHLRPPTLNPQLRDEWVVVGGATGNVGSHGVRLASAAGYKVLALASQKDFPVAKSLGATDVLDARPAAPLLLENTLAEALKERTIAGAFDATGVSSVTVAIAKGVAACKGKRVVATVASEVDDDVSPVAVKTVMAIDIRNNEVGSMVWGDFMPKALANGKYFMPYPKAAVYGNGLNKIQAAMGTKAKAGEKFVVTL